jgi:microcystin-dependent protein
MREPWLGEIALVAFNHAPAGWAFCDGQLLPVEKNQALFSLLGNTHGGDGKTTFGLPNLQSRVAQHFGVGKRLNYIIAVNGYFPSLS